MSNKTYAIKDGSGTVVALVEANSKSIALRHLAEQYFRADLATAADGIAATKAGIEVQVAGTKPAAGAGDQAQGGQAQGGQGGEG